MEHVKVSLLDKNNEVQYGLNWGQREKRDPNQSYLQLTTEIYRGDFFPPKGKFFIVNTDDNKTLILTRAQKDLGCALQTPENNALLGSYIRSRLGVPSGQEITKQDILKNGTSFFTFSKIDDMHYYLNFGEAKDFNYTKDLNDKEPLQQIFYGAPGTGKSFAIDNLTNDVNTVRTTFHPDSDYASFVGAYKPTMEDIPMSYISEGLAKYAKAWSGHEGKEKKIVYKYVPQAFLKAYVAAWSDLDNPHYLVIEEINRGNCAQIFGDLFQLLDRNSRGSSSYAIHADDDIRQFLSTDSKGFGNLSVQQKQAIANFVLVKDNGKRSEIGPKILTGELLLLPPNLRIWATMNTSDQSLFPIDSAFKRRWNWHYVPIEYDKKDWLLHIGENYYRWGDFLKAINPIISELTESADKQMGYFFAKPDEKHGETTENNTISEDVFINKVLFYLWTDVLKDFDAGKEPFLNPDTKRAYEFSDFFDANHNYLEQFVGKLGLDVVDINFDSITDDDSDDGDADTTDPIQRDYSRYSINGEGKYNKRQTVLRSLRKYVEANPSMTSEEIIENWKSVNPEIPYFILSASQYETRIKEYPAQHDRYWSVMTGTEEKVYITNQWGAGRIAEFIKLINNSNFGLHIDKVTDR